MRVQFVSLGLAIQSYTSTHLKEVMYEIPNPIKFLHSFHHVSPDENNDARMIRQSSVRIKK